MYKRLLRLYPRGHRAIFAAEMSAVYENAAAEHRRRGRMAYLRFALAEWIGLVLGAGEDWLAKFTSSSYMAGLYLPVKMRPPNKTREQWWRARARVPEEPKC